jgi:hypothetical protein
MGSSNIPVLAQNNQPQVVDKLTNVQRLGKLLAASGYFTDARDMAQAAVKVMAGEELGIAPVASMMGINIIKGKVSLSANLLAAQVVRHGYIYRVKQHDHKGCVLVFVGKDGKVLGESSFGESEAKAAKVFNEMYEKYPRNMYFSRAMSNGVKWYCPEITSGLPVYTPEELGAGGVDPLPEDGRPNLVSDLATKGGNPPDPQRTTSNPQGAPQPELSDGLKDMFDRMKRSKFEALGIFKQLKDTITKAFGTEEKYREILCAHIPQSAWDPELKAAKATGFTDHVWGTEGKDGKITRMNAMRAAARQMYELLEAEAQRRASEQGPEPERQGDEWGNE